MKEQTGEDKGVVVVVNTDVSTSYGWMTCEFTSFYFIDIRTIFG